jgi:hypothetical protein
MLAQRVPSAFIGLALMSPVQAASPQLFGLGQGVVGALHRPAAPGPKARIAVYVMHAEQDYLDFSACSESASRGYTVLCANNSASKSGMMNDLGFEQMMLDVAKGRPGCANSPISIRSFQGR